MKILKWIVHKILAITLFATLIAGGVATLAAGHFMPGRSQLEHVGVVAVLLTVSITATALVFHAICYMENETSPLSYLKLKHVKIAGFVIMLLSLLIGSSAWRTNEKDNLTYAKLETVVTSKRMVLDCDKKSCPTYPTWSYSYETTVGGISCGYPSDTSVKVNYVWHKCPSGYEDVSESEWQKLRVGQVLKVVELK
jgi:hypothetical protein